MTPIDDRAVDAKSLVARGYDRCAAVYDAARRQEDESALAMLTERLEDGAAVLDVGCGPGVPVVRTLARRYTVTGVDISAQMIERARQNVPEATFIHGDIMSVDVPAAHFDAVVSFYAIFHLPREEHAALFVRIHRWLRPGGYLLATVGLHDEPAYTEEFFGETMHWSNYSLEATQAMLKNLGFNLINVTMLGHGYDAAHAAPEERHPLVFAQVPR